MESLIKLKVKFDLLTHRISKYAERKQIKFTLKVIYWLVIAFIAYDFYKYGVSTGNSILLSTFITIVLIKHMKKRVVEKTHGWSLLSFVEVPSADLFFPDDEG